MALPEYEPSLLCFNPCSIGFSFRSEPSQSFILKVVSILVLLDFPFGVNCVIFICFIFAAFQSLFYWIFLSEFRFYGPTTEFSDLFQSLFYWIFLSELAGTFRPFQDHLVSILVLLDFPFGADDARTPLAPTSGFNPCSIGFSFRRNGEVYIHDSIWMFQSLFYWIFLSEKLYPKAANAVHGFQSLFYWIFLSEPSELVSSRNRIQVVSILVLLDFPFGGWISWSL